MCLCTRHTLNHSTNQPHRSLSFLIHTAINLICKWILYGNFFSPSWDCIKIAEIYESFITAHDGGCVRQLFNKSGFKTSIKWVFSFFFCLWDDHLNIVVCRRGQQLPCSSTQVLRWKTKQDKTINGRLPLATSHFCTLFIHVHRSVLGHLKRSIVNVNVDHIDVTIHFCRFHVSAPSSLSQFDVNSSPWHQKHHFFGKYCSNSQKRVRQNHHEQKQK